VAKRPRKRGTGAITKLPSGSFRAQLSLPGSGRQRIGQTFRVEDDAKHWLREQTRRLRAGEDPDEARTTVAAHLDDWLENVGHSIRPMTLRGYRAHVETWIVPAIGSVRMSDLTARHVRLVRDRVTKAGRSPRTAAGVLLTLRMALGQAVDDGLVSRNLADAVRPPRPAPRQVVATSPDDARAILAAFKGHRLEGLVAAAIGTGLRQGELLGLRWSDITGDRIRVAGSVRPVPRAGGHGYELERSDQAKTRRSIRSIEAPPFVVAALAEERRRQAAENLISPYVFVTRGRRENEGKAVFLDGINVTRAFQRQLAAKGLPTMRWHDLRHAYATLMLSVGVPLRVIQEALGHTSIATTAGIYAHVLPALQRDAAAKLEEALTK